MLKQIVRKSARRAAAGAMAVGMALSLLPAAAFAAAEAQPCGHKEHSEVCYTEELICGLEEGAVMESGELHVHVRDCRKLDCPHERGEHDEACGYAGEEDNGARKTAELCDAVDALPGLEELYQSMVPDSDPGFDVWIEQTLRTLDGAGALLEDYESLTKEQKDQVGPDRADKLADLADFSRRLGETAVQDFTGSGTSAADPYIISSYAGLAELAANVSGGNTYEGKYIRLADNFSSLEGKATAAIGAIADGKYKYFMGSFDGGGQTVRVSIIAPESDNQGLFGCVSGATIANVTVTGEVTGKVNVGGVAGYLYPGAAATVKNCTNEAIINGSSKVGGVVGMINQNNTVENCANNTAGTVKAEKQVGGVAGESYGTIKNCTNAGAVTGTDSNGFVGGVVGIVSDFSEKKSTVEGCANTGAVSGTRKTGGVTGYNAGSLKACWNAGTVSGSIEYVGGVAGANIGSVVLENSYNIGEINGDRDVGGVVGNNQNSTVRNCWNSAAVKGSGNVGGVTGSNGTGGTVQNCVALGLTATGGSRVGRAAGASAATLAGIRARDDMKIGREGKETEVDSENTETERNGADAVVGAVDLAAVFGGWDDSIWNIPGGRLDYGCELPVLKNSMPDAAPTLPGERVVEEQYTLALGNTYYFDLSAMADSFKGQGGTIGESLPDATLHYVPFTYAGTVYAYSRTEEGVSGEDGVVPGDRSLFVANYNVSNNVTWEDLESQNLIFGAGYDSGGVSYSLRAPSVGSQGNGQSAAAERGVPESNEWDAILNKGGDIPGAAGVYSWGQDSALQNTASRACRGDSSARSWDSHLPDARNEFLGFRPFLELPNPAGVSGGMDLTAITLKLNGGKLGGGEADLRIAVKAGADYKAPGETGITAPEGKVFDGWKGDNAQNYKSGDTVPASVAVLTARWKNERPSFITAPAIREGDVGVTTAKVYFASDMDGKAHYIADPASTPDAETVRRDGAAIDAAEAAEEIISLSGLASGCKHILYVVLENGAGKLSDMKSAAFHTAPDISAAIINYIDETISFDAVYEMNSAADFTGNALAAGGSISDYISEYDTEEGSLKKLYLRVKAANGVPVGPVTAISIPARPRTPDAPVVEAGAGGLTVTAVPGVEYTVNDWTDSSTAGAFTGLDSGTAYTVRARAAATGSSFKSAEAAKEARTLTVVSAPTGTEAAKGTVAADKTAAAVGDTVTYTVRFEDAYTPELTLSGNNGLLSASSRGQDNTWTWTYTITEGDKTVGAAVTFAAREISSVIPPAGGVTLFADAPGNASAVSLKEYLDGSVGVWPVYDNGATGAAVSAGYTLPAGVWNAKGGTYVCTAAAGGKSCEVEVTVKPVAAAIGAVTDITKVRQNAGYAGHSALGLPENAAVTYTGDGYAARTENLAFSWSDVPDGFGKTVGSHEFTGAVSLPEWATYTQDTAKATVTIIPGRYELRVEKGAGSGEFDEGTEITVTAGEPQQGMRFKMWTAEGISLTDAERSSAAVTIIMPGNDVLLTAVYEDIPAPTYTITFETNGGSALPSVTAQTGTDGRLAVLPAPSRGGYRFNGWFTAASGGIQVSADTVFTANTTVYAQWTALSSGSGGGGTTIGGGSAPSIVAPDQPDAPTTAETEMKAQGDGKGGAEVTADKDTVDSMIRKAKEEAGRNGNQDNRIAVRLNVAVDGLNINSTTVNLPKVTQEHIINNQVETFIVVLARPDIALSLSLASVQEINRQANADVQLTAARILDLSVLSEEARAEIGDRPAFYLTAAYQGDEMITNFGGGSVNVALPYTLKPGESEETLCALYVDDGGSVHYLSDCSYDAERGMLLFTTGHFSVFSIGHRAPAAEFSDIQGHWAREDIEFAASRGLMAGTGGDKFTPEGAMTRAMFVTVLGRLAGIDPADYSAGGFTDVPENAYYTPYVAWAEQAKVVKGIGGGLFAPERAVTRQEMAVIMRQYAGYRMYELPVTHKAMVFTDNDSIENWAADSVRVMQQAGILTGSPQADPPSGGALQSEDGCRFDPLGTATRAEAAAVLHHFVELVMDRQSVRN